MTGEIDISQGVKQGDPLSPTLFNIVMDPLFQQLKVKGQAKTVGDENKVKVGEVYCLAYVDDTALIADSHKDNQVNIYLTWEFCEAVGLGLSIHKCAACEIRSYGKTFICNHCTPLTVGETEIPSMKPGEFNRYLGENIGPWGASDKAVTTNVLQQYCVVVVVNHCFTSLFGTKGLLSDIIIR